MISPVKTWYKNVALWLGAAVALVAAASTLSLLLQYHDRIVTLEGELEQARTQTDDVKSRLAREKKELADQADLLRQTYTQKLDSEAKRASQAELLAESEQTARQTEAARWARDSQTYVQKLDSETRRASQAELLAASEKSARQVEATRLSRAEQVAREQEDARRAAEARVQEPKRQVWCVARLRNETTFSIVYQLIDDNGARNSVTLRPLQELVLTGKTVSMAIKFDSSTKAGYQEGRYTLRTVQSVNRPTSDLDMRTAPVNYFSTPNGVNIELRVRAN